jgi:general stress protein YciG
MMSERRPDPHPFEEAHDDPAPARMCWTCGLRRNDPIHVVAKPPRGFAALTPERRRELAHMGGLASKGKGHRWTIEQARAAGQKGGRAHAERRRRHNGNGIAP